MVIEIVLTGDPPYIKILPVKAAGVAKYDTFGVSDCKFEINKIKFAKM